MLSAAGALLSALSRHIGQAWDISGLADVINQPVRAYLDAHTAGLPVAADTVYLVWLVSGGGLLFFSLSGIFGARLTWILRILPASSSWKGFVLLDVLVKLLGEYADVAPPGFLMARPFEGHPTDLAELHGRRVIVCSELKAGDRFNEARVKLLTGGDKLKPRRMRQDFSSFNPTHKLFALGNHRPEVNTGGFAFWRRMRLIPFERVVPDARKVDNLADILVTEEGPGILAWLIDGARRYLGGEKDLTGPERVLRAEQKHLYLAYTRWCESEGATPVSSRAFAARVREVLGVRSPKDMATSNSKKYYQGIGLIADTTEETA